MLALFAERGGDPDRPGKRTRSTALLWRAERPGRAGLGRRRSAAGRPGWHIECTAIALEHLGTAFDVQGGGTDLVFPHHEMCAVHAQVADGSTRSPGPTRTRGWCGWTAEKMSKSRGNLVWSPSCAAAGVDPPAIRLAAARAPLPRRLGLDRRRAGRGRAAARWRGPRAAGRAGRDGTAGPAYASALADDLDAPGALAARRRLGASGSDADGDDPRPSAAGLVARPVDALLGVRL